MQTQDLKYIQLKLSSEKKVCPSVDILCSLISLSLSLSLSLSISESGTASLQSSPPGPSFQLAAEHTHDICGHCGRKYILVYLEKISVLNCHNMLNILHLCGFPTPPNPVVNFDPVEHFQTVPELVNRKYNRPQVEMLQKNGALLDEGVDQRTVEV